jgi:hypothetical protein
MCRWYESSRDGRLLFFNITGRRKCFEISEIHYNKLIQVVAKLQIAVAPESYARNVFAQSNTGVVSSSPTRGMDICVRLFYVFVALPVGSGLGTG